MGTGAGGGTGTGTGMETRGRSLDGNGDGNESSSGDGNGNEGGSGDGNKDGKRKKPHKSGRRHAGSWEDLGKKRIKHRQERIGSVASNPDHLENSKEAGGEAQGTQCVPSVASDQRFSY